MSKSHPPDDPDVAAAVLDQFGNASKDACIREIIRVRTRLKILSKTEAQYRNQRNAAADALGRVARELVGIGETE